MPRSICTYSPQRRASAYFVSGLEPCLAHRRDSVELIVGGERNFSPLVWKWSSRGLCLQLHGPINLDSLNQFELFSIIFHQKHPNWCETLFTPLVSCKAPHYPVLYFSLAPLPAALERPCSLWRCLLTLYPGSQQFQWSSRLPQSVTLGQFPTLLARVFSENSRFVYPVVHLCLSLKAPHRLDVQNQTHCGNTHITSCICFWLIASPSTQKPALCLISRHMGLVTKS